MRPIDADAFERELMFSEEAFETLDDDEMAFVLRKLADAPTILQWIPCSERLPMPLTNVLITASYYGRRYTTCAYLKHDGEWKCEIMGYGGLFGSTVIAWMPLPEPYEQTERSE